MSEKILYTLRAPSEVPLFLARTLLKAPPEITIGYRPCWNLIVLAKKLNLSIIVPSSGDFYLQELFCSFAPTKTEKIDKAELEITVEEPSIVYEMAPRGLTDASEHENEFGVSAGLNIEPVKIGINYVRKWKSKSVVPKLYTFGIGNNRARWTFSRGLQETLFGTQDLNLIIMSPKGGDASLSIELDAISNKKWSWSSRYLPPEKKVIRVGTNFASD
jgi:hypothetical protein